MSDQRVAALFVIKNGPYYQDPLIDPWDQGRDARLYRGPFPVVAHPPCQLWTNFAFLNFKRWGGEHNRPGNDGGCFGAAKAAVDCWYGVLEHPAFSHAWGAHGLARPGKGPGWSPSGTGWVCEVWQSAYGHRARKRTWLYAAGTRRPFDLRWTRVPGTHQIGAFDRIKPTLQGRAAIETPAEFKSELLRLARWMAA